jgi:hypothetical protein
MTDPYGTPAYPGWDAPVGTAYPEPPGTATPPRRTAEDHTNADLRVAGTIVAALVVLGALLGLVWSAWSGPQQRAFVIGPGRLYPYDEVETMAAADGRYLVLVGAVGLLAALVAWLWRPRNRGPLVLLALCVGGLAGAALTAWVGHLTGGGTFAGKSGSTIAHLPLSVHLRGLLFVEPAIAALVYGLFVAFAARDDLGRADPAHERRSVGAGDQPQHGWGYGDAPSALQQRDLPTQ